MNIGPIYGKTKGYKYRLLSDVTFQTAITGYERVAAFREIHPDGRVIARAGYAWDGPSGPTIDTPDYMAGSLVHDVLYQDMREGVLPPEVKDAADRELQKVCLECGMWRIRAWVAYHGVRLLGRWAMKRGWQKRERVYRLLMPPEYARVKEKNTTQDATEKKTE